VIGTLDELATRLVQTAPALDPDDVRALLDGLRANGSALALAIARAVELVDEQLIDAGVALPALAEACGVLVDPHSDERALDAARYRVDTLSPVPDGRPSAIRFDALVTLRKR
jgi:hypothetical protein